MTTEIINNSDISPERYVFWLNDITVLFKNDSYIKFIPTNDMTRIEQLNALTRLFIYLTILFVILGKTDDLIYIPLIGIVFCIILYNLFEIDDTGKRKELQRMKRNTTSKNYELPIPDINYRTYQVNDNGEIITVDIDQQEQEKFDKSKNKNQTEYDIEVGYYDSNGNIVYGDYNGALNKNHTSGMIDPTNPTKFDKDNSLNDLKNIKYTMDEIRLYENAKCRRPTNDNPFMNPSLDDLNKENVPVACNSDDEDIQNEISNKFNQDMYRDIEDVFNRKNSQRQFYTVHQSIPNDQEAFARWCYGFPPTCKTDQQYCLRYQDLRTKY